MYWCKLVYNHLKFIMNRMKMFFNYLFFRDMGNLGEGCLISAFIWLIIMLAIIGVFCLY